MGDVIKSFPVRSNDREKSIRIRLYFDSGSPFTFITRSAAFRFRDVFPLSRPSGFHGLGQGRFVARDLLNMEVRMAGYWCRHPAYVVDDAVLDDKYDVLVGHDFMQKFNVGLAPRRRAVVLDRGAIRMAQTVHCARAAG